MSARLDLWVIAIHLFDFEIVAIKQTLYLGDLSEQANLNLIFNIIIIIKTQQRYWLWSVVKPN